MFDEIERTETRAREDGESNFLYLNMSARPEAARVRQAIEAMFDHYPESGRVLLRSRLRSELDEQHNSAVFELAVHELFRRTGHTLTELEPEAPHKRTRPDFLFSGPNGEAFYLEVVLSTGLSLKAAKEQARLNEVLRQIGRMECTTHWLEVHPRGRPQNSIALKQLRHQLAAWIKTLPSAGNSARPFKYEEHGLRLTIDAVLRRKLGKAGDSAVGQLTTGFEPVTTSADIRSRLKKKAGRYGKLNKPFVLAVNSLGVPSGERDVLEALFGDRDREVTLADGTKRTTWLPTVDSLWGGKVAQYTRVSAVLSVDRMGAWDLARRSARFIVNPRAAHPLTSDFKIDRLHISNGMLERTTGVHMRELFELSEDWP